MAGNPFEIPGFQFTLNAGADVTWRRFMKVDANGDVVYATAAADVYVGVSTLESLAGRPVGIIGDGIAFIEAGAAITAGTDVVPGTDGKAVDGSGDGTAVALTDATADGDLICIKF